MYGSAIVNARRTPFAPVHSALAAWHPVDLCAALLADAVDEPDSLDAVVVECQSPVGAQGDNLARAAVLAAGWRESLPALVVSGGGGMGALITAAGLVASGAARRVCAVGIEVMSTVPMGASAMARHAYGKPWGEGVARRYAAAGGLLPEARRVDAWAREMGITRAEQDDWAARSVAAARACAPSPELINIGTLITDQFALEADTSRDELPPLFDPEGSITAGNSAMVADGAVAVVIERRDDRAASTMAGAIACTRMVGRSPIGGSPVVADLVRRACGDAGWDPAQLDLIELHEGFAATAIASARALPTVPVNPRGGTLAFGNPHGAAGLRLVSSAWHQLRAGQRGAAAFEAGDLAIVVLLVGRAD